MTNTVRGESLTNSGLFNSTVFCTLYACIGCSNLTVSPHLQMQKISAWHVLVCESVWLQSPIRDCFTYCCLRCYGHGGGRKHYGKWLLMPQARVRGEGRKISLMVFTWRQPPCCEHRLTVTVYGWTSSYPKGLLTRIGLMFTYKRLRAKSGKLNKYIFCKLWEISFETKSDKYTPL